MTKPLTKENLIAEMRKFVRPVNFHALEARGLLTKAGAWYHAPSVRKLPDHVAAKITKIKSSRGKTYVRFYSAASMERAKKMLKKPLAQS